MTLSPLDVDNRRFRSALRGYQPAEVDQFLAAVTEVASGVAVHIISAATGQGLEQQDAERVGQRGHPVGPFVSCAAWLRAQA